MKRLHATFLVTVALAIIVTNGMFSPPVSAAMPSAGTCKTVRLPMAPAPSQPRTTTIAGTLCTPKRWAAGPHALDILVPGGMYNSMYWDWPQNPRVYSYATKTLQAGRATFAYDRLGTGASSHPVSENVTFAADVYNLHSIIQHYRSSYSRITTVGHSLGSAIAAHEAGQYNDVNRLVLTGLTHGHGIGFLTLPTTIQPAILNPRLAKVIPLLDVGYVTSLPGKRADLFYSSNADRAVIAYDERHKDAMTLGVATGAITSLTTPPGLNITNKITAPVLMVIGQEDAPFCNVDVSCKRDSSLYNFEKAYFTRSLKLTVRTIPDTGHNLPLHPSAETSFTTINEWIETR